MKYLLPLLMSVSVMFPAFANDPQAKPNTEMKLAKKKADKEKEAKENKEKGANDKKPQPSTPSAASKEAKK